MLRRRMGMSERRPADATISFWKEIVLEILPRACARQAGEGGRAIALAARCGFSSGAVAKVVDDARREYDGLVVAQQKLAELLASGQLAGAEQRSETAQPQWRAAKTNAR